MKVACFDMKHWNKEHVSRLLEDYELQFFEGSLQEESLESAAGAEVVCIFIASRLTKDVLDKLPSLKLVCTMSTGFDHIDLEECKSRGITVCNIPYYGENTVAEHAFALLMAIAKKIPEAVARTKEEDFSLDGLVGFDLSEKTIGIIGGGHIGVHSIRIAKGFGMEVLVFDVHKEEDLAKKLGFKYTELDELLSASDIITIHVPYNEHTHHLLNREKFEKVKKGCVLINTARGAIVETESLVWALDSGILSAAGLDVMEGEQLIGHVAHNSEEERLVELDEKLLQMPNVVVTPHSAFDTKEALARIEKTTCDNIKAFKEGNIQNNIGR